MLILPECPYFLIPEFDFHARVTPYTLRRLVFVVVVQSKGINGTALTFLLIINEFLLPKFDFYAWVGTLKLVHKVANFRSRS